MPSSSPISRRALLAGGAGATTAFSVLRFAPDALANTGPQSYTASWSSVDQHPPAPTWFQDAKFGIYYHWGAFSVPAFGNEWYPRNMYNSGSAENQHHIATYGNPSSWPYHNFVLGANDKSGNYVKFAPKLVSAGGKWDPNAWAQLFKNAGAKYAGPVAEHHDGYSMWNSQANEWNSVKTGPGLDLVSLHAQAIRAQGLKFMASLHHAYHFNGYYQYVPQQSTATLQKLYGQMGSSAENQLWYNKLQEVIDGYQPDLVWQDFSLNNVQESQRLAFLAHYYNQAVAWNKDVVATYKDGLDNLGEVYDFERGGPGGLLTPFWLTDDSISSSSWCYTVGIGYYTTQALLHALIDRVAKGGNMLLNIAPMADGTIPQGQRDILLGIGDHLSRFGEAVYATRAWTAYGEGPTKMGGGSFTTPIAGTAQDIRFTRSKDGTVLYATALGWPGSAMSIATLSASRIDLTSLTKVELLGSTAGTYISVAAPVQDGGGLHVTLPSSAPYSAQAYTLKLTFSGAIPTLRPAAAVTVCQDVNYAGASAGLALGGYTAAQLQSAGLATRSISSLRVGPGYQVVGYAGDNFTGTAWTFTADNADLRPGGNNDAIVSLQVTFNPAAYVRLTNVTDNLALDSGGNVPSGSNLKQWTWNSSPNLQWQIVDLGTGYYRLVNRTNGMVADSWGAANGQPAQQAPWNGGTNQQWQITDRGNGQYTIANRTTGLVLDGGGQVASGSVTKQWTWNGSSNLLWYVMAV